MFRVLTRRTLARGPRPTSVLRARASQRAASNTAVKSDPPVWPFVLSFVAFASASLYFIIIPDESRAAPTKTTGSLSPRHFTPLPITSHKHVGANGLLMTLTLPPEQLSALQSTSDNGYQPIWSVFIKDDDIQVERPYTPLYGLEKDGKMSFWIKKYPKGEVGRWLHGKSEGDRIEIRGPLTTWPWKDDAWDEVVMISGGTGITPFVQLWSTVIASERSPNTRFTLLHSSPSSDELPPAEVLSPLASYAAEHPERFNFRLFVDQDAKPLPYLPAATATPALGRINKLAVEKAVNSGKTEGSWWKRPFTSRKPSEETPQRRVLFLVCGPEPMIGALAGPYGRNFSQGPVGGVLKELGYSNDSVYKL